MDRTETEKIMWFPKSLSSLLALWGLLIVGTMLVLLGGVRWATSTDFDFDLGVLDHGWPVLALGTGIFLASWVILDRTVFFPLRKISSQLCGVEAGRHPRPLEVHDEIQEIQTIVDVFNLMTRRLEQRFDGAVIAEFQENFELIRAAIISIADRSPAQAAEVLDHLAVLENAFTSIVNIRPSPVGVC